MQRMSEWREGVYVRLYGNMTEFEGNFRLLAYIVRKVTDFNEVCVPYLASPYLMARVPQLVRARASEPNP